MGKLTPLEVTEQPRCTERVVERRLGAGEGAVELVAADTEGKVTPDDEEQDHGDDLADETANHDVGAGLGTLLVLGSCSDTTTNGLEN